MNTKENIILALEASKGEYVSGESLAEDLGVSRNAVWKGVNELKKTGYPIDSVRNKGYKLNASSDIVSKAGITMYLGRKAQKSTIKKMLDNLYVYDEIDSTNNQAKRNVYFEGYQLTHKTIVIAKSQSAGQGHKGSSYDSPEGGIYLSIILDPKSLRKDEPVNITISDIVCNVIEKMYQVQVQRKEYNAIFVGKKKVSGILTDAVTELETGEYKSFISGVGIRADILGEISGVTPSKNEIIAVLMEEFSKM
jgi:BirA family biotin operon repressor/biotin-[acetyl-CoA-carboxylase] ligase